MIKVSAIVPVYNPGDDIDDCIRTLVLEQSLPVDEYEVIFVDDGSTDATPARLDALAAEHAHVRVEHIENSGWPGRPRNVGIDMARGEFVFFVDNDDYVSPQALERLYAVAVRDRADVVIGKVVGRGKGVPRGVFARNRSGATLAKWPGMLWLLSPHKLFLRSFLVEHGIRFPEGRRRLEDHVFVTHAYLHAQAVSVLADYPCYYWVRRGEGTNASLRPFDPAMYYANVREVLDLVDEHTEPGELRDRLYVRWYRGKALQRAGGKAFLRYPEDYRRERYDEIRQLVLERFDPRLDAYLPATLRLRAQLVRAGDYEGVKALAAYEQGLAAVARLRSAKRAAGGKALELALDARLGAKRGAPLTFRRQDGALRWAAPPELAAEPLDSGDVADAVAAADLYVFLRSAADGSEFGVGGKWSTELAPVAGDAGRVKPVVKGTARVSGREGAAGSALAPGKWDLHATLTVAGFRASGRVRRRGSSDPVRLRVRRDGSVVEDRAKLRTRMAARWPAAARLAKRAGL